MEDALFEKIMDENSSEYMNDTKPQIKEAQLLQARQKKKNPQNPHLDTLGWNWRMPKTKKTLKATREEKTDYLQSTVTTIRLRAGFPLATTGTRRQWRGHYNELGGNNRHLEFYSQWRYISKVR